MKYIKAYYFKNINGIEDVITKKNSSLKKLGFKRILLDAGQTLEYEVKGEEQAIVLQAGDFIADVEYKGRTVISGAKGDRNNVFDDLPTSLYLPPKSKVKITSNGGMEARVYTAYCDEGNTPYFCPPEQIKESEPGTYIYKRKYRIIFGAQGKHNCHITKKLIIGESISVPGGWIGFPAHRHDQNTENETITDEIFSFKISGFKGAGLMEYSFNIDEQKNRLWDETNIIDTDNAAVAISVGYHTTFAFPGTTVYMLWGLAGDCNILKAKFDERYTHLEDCMY